MKTMNKIILLVMLTILSGSHVCANQVIVMVGNLPNESKTATQVTTLCQDAFDRIGYDFKYELYPNKRCIQYSSTGLKDGEIARIHDFNATIPSLIRVEEPVGSFDLAAYAIREDIHDITSMSDIKNRGYSVGFKAGIKLIESQVSGVIEANKVTAVTKEEIFGFRMLAAQRFDIYLGIPASIWDDFILDPEFKEKKIRNIGILESQKLYMFLHEKHKDMVPKLAQALREVKEQGEK